ncbi:MAG TPA: hypothetical protein VEI80_01050 [Candidatus Acidoferrales bacterium]|nr:hypothetical protein [Candidatus Acidoferrales bacterium]
MKAILVLAVVLVATSAATFYYLSSTKPPYHLVAAQFHLSISPSSVHISPGWGQNLTVTVARAPNFTGDIQVAVGGPSWIMFSPLVIHAPVTNGTLFVMAGDTAPIGSTDIQVGGVAAGMAAQTVSATVTVSGVFNVSSPSGTAEIFNTTKVLDNTTMTHLTSLDNSTGVIEFSAVTPLLQGLSRGDTIVGPHSISPAAMQGFLLVVLSVQVANGTVTLQTSHATIFDVFRTAQLGAASASASNSSSTSLGVQSLNPDKLPTGEFTILPTFTVNPNKDLPGGFSVGAVGTLGLDGWWGIDMTQWAQDLCLGSGAAAAVWLGGGYAAGGAMAACVFVSSQVSLLHFFQFSLKPTESIDIYFKGKAGTSTLPTVNLLEVMGPESPPALYPGYVPVFPPFLWLDVAFSINLKGSWTFVQAPDLEWKQQLNDVEFGFWYCDQSYVSKGHCDGNTGWSFIHNGDSTGGFVTQGFSSKDSFEVKLGPTVSVDLDSGVATIGGSAWGFLAFEPSSQIPGTPTITSPADGSKIDLSNPDFLPSNIFDWTATAPGPQGAQVSCLWFADTLGQIGQSNNGDCNLDVYDTGQLVNRILTVGGSGVHRVAVTALWSNLPASDVDLGLGFNGNVSVLWGLLKTSTPDITLASTAIAHVTGGTAQVASNPVSVTFILPTPQLLILNPLPGATVTEGTPIDAIAHATLATVVSQTNPDGLIHLCLIEPQNFNWFVGGYFEADMVDLSDGSTGGAWTGAVAYGTGCVASLTIPSSGQTATYQATIYLVLGATDAKSGQWYIPEDLASNPVIPFKTVTVNVQPKTSSAASPPIVQIINPASGSGPYGYTSTVTLQGTVSSGTPPYTTATWTATYHGSYTIATGPPSSTLNYQWTIGQTACNGLGLTTQNTVFLSLTVTDSAHATGASQTVPITLNCAYSQSIKPILGVGLTSLLSVFAAAEEQFVYDILGDRTSFKLEIREIQRRFDEFLVRLGVNAFSTLVSD